MKTIHKTATQNLKLSKVFQDLTNKSSKWNKRKESFFGS